MVAPAGPAKNRSIVLAVQVNFISTNDHSLCTQFTLHCQIARRVIKNKTFDSLFMFYEQFHFFFNKK